MLDYAKIKSQLNDISVLDAPVLYHVGHLPTDCQINKDVDAIEVRNQAWNLWMDRRAILYCAHVKEGMPKFLGNKNIGGHSVFEYYAQAVPRDMINRLVYNGDYAEDAIRRDKGKRYGRGEK